MVEPDLPPLPSSRSAPPPLPRKRTYTDYDVNSSDPALFSSDDHLPGVEDYATKRQKTIWQGSWFGGRLRNTSARRKRSFKRNHDSGVFMGSDGTDASLEDAFLADHQASKTEKSTRDWSPIFESCSLSTVKRTLKQTAQTDPALPSRYQAQAVILRCLEDGSENVDLSSMSLETVPSEISTLKSLTKHTRIADPPTSQEAYSSIEAKLRLYLAHNSLKRVPLPVLELENLRLLSLRQNNLTHIPGGIRRLVNLESLNVAGNNLTYLPFEILELFHHHTLVVLVADPNPWEEWLPSRDEGSDEVSLTNATEDLTDCPCYARVHAGIPTFFRANGSHCCESQTLNTLQAVTSKVPHLTELTLRCLQRLPELSSVDNAIIEELPETAQRMLGEARDAQLAGGRQCTKCHKTMVMPRKQWIERWSIGPSPGPFLGRTLPFLRQQCHEQCDGRDDAWTAKHILS